MIETAHQFGTHGGLAGVLCQPTDAGPPGAPAVVFSNVGFNHRVGPNRGWVELARVLAAAGVPSLRFDLSGLGDSEPRGDAPNDSERAALDLSEALEFLEQRGVARRFVLVGNCSGVDSLHVVACRDERVAGAVYIDGYAYRNFGYRWRRLLADWSRPGWWWGWLARKLRGGGRPQDQGEQQQLWKRDIPTRERFAADVDALVQREVKLLFVFTGGMHPVYNYRAQFHDGFGHRGRVDVEFYPLYDHLFSRAAWRAALNQRIRDWMARAFSVQTP
jgi:hypothetical protein